MDSAALEATSGIGSYEWHPVADRLVWSEGLIKIYGVVEAPTAEQGFSHLVHPDDRSRVEAETLGFFTSTATSYEHDFRIVRPDGSVRFILDRGTIERDATGEVTLIRGVNIDLTDVLQSDHLADFSKRTSAERLAELEELYAEAPMGLGLLDREMRFVRVNRRLAEINGFSIEQHLGRTVWDLVPDLRASAEPALRHVLERGEPLRDVVVRGETPARPGVEREWREHLYPIRDGAGVVQGVGINCQEVTDQVAVEHALRAANDSFRQLVDRSPFGIYAVDADFRIALVGDGAQKVFENVRPLIGRDLAEALHILWPEPFANEAIGHFRHTLETGEAYHAPSTIERRADIQATEAYDWKIERITMPDGRPGVVCHFYDLSERQSYEEKIEYLMREVNHRAKNMLALVDAVARQTAYAGTEDFLERFSERVRALGASQDLLVQTEWAGADLGSLIEGQLMHFSDLIGSRIMVSGPAIDITPRAAQSLGMALHELSTNAAKYGALSGDKGQIAIAWGIEEGADEPAFVIRWEEKDGPPVSAPTRKGFGTRVTKAMIEATLSANVALGFAETGVVWELRCPLKGVGTVTTAAKCAAAPPPPAEASPRPCMRGILVVEDDAMLALDLAESLEEAGFTVIGPAASVAQALALVEAQTPGFAVLDVNLGSETSERIALWLRGMSVPFVSLSAYSRAQQPAAFQDMPFIPKPAQLSSLLNEIARAGLTAA